MKSKKKGRHYCPNGRVDGLRIYDTAPKTYTSFTEVYDMMLEGHSFIINEGDMYWPRIMNVDKTGEPRIVYGGGITPTPSELKGCTYYELPDVNDYPLSYEEATYMMKRGAVCQPILYPLRYFIMNEEEGFFTFRYLTCSTPDRLTERYKEGLFEDWKPVDRLRYDGLRTVKWRVVIPPKQRRKILWEWH